MVNLKIPQEHLLHGEAASVINAKTISKDDIGKCWLQEYTGAVVWLAKEKYAGNLGSLFRETKNLYNIILESKLKYTCFFSAPTGHLVTLQVPLKAGGIYISPLQIIRLLT